MKNQCLISSYKGDFVWLQFCLRSLAKFSSGFLPPVISVSMEDLEVARYVVQKTYPEAEVFVHSLPHGIIPSTKGIGMMRAMNSMMHGDVLCPDADNVFLVGSDCLATEAFTPRMYLNGKGQPIVLTNSYEKLRELHPDALPWRNGTAEVLGFSPLFEYMRRLPSVYHKSTFLKTREYIEKLHGQRFNDYWYGSFLEGQQGQSEANLLGAYAYKFQQPMYDFQCIDFIGPKHNPLLQFWSHGGLDKPIDIHYNLNEVGRDVFGSKPRDVIHQILGDANSLEGIA
jgi:hypothetical protein